MNMEQMIETERNGNDSTKLSLIRAAEKLFGVSGVEAVSLRSICAEAGQKNIGSVQYHFGSKEKLLTAIFAYREQQLEPMRLAGLHKAEQSGTLNDPTAMLRIIFEPYARMYIDHDNIGYIKLVSYYLTYVRPLGRVPHPADRSEQSSPGLQQAMRGLHQSLAPMDEPTFMRRMDWMGALFLNSMIQFSKRRPANRKAKLDLLEELIAMMREALPAKV